MIPEIKYQVPTYSSWDTQSLMLSDPWCHVRWWHWDFAGFFFSPRLRWLSQKEFPRRYMHINIVYVVPRLVSSLTMMKSLVVVISDRNLLHSSFRLRWTWNHITSMESSCIELSKDVIWYQLAPPHTVLGNNNSFRGLTTLSIEVTDSILATRTP